MDPHHFDAFTRALVAPGSRRRVLGGLVAGALGLVGAPFGSRDAEAAVICRAPGRVCRENANCCSGVCGAHDATGRRRCRCRSAADCPPPTNHCLAATCSTAGVCGTTVAVVCTASDQCHLAGTCDPTTGTCSNPAAANGTSCSDRNPLCVDRVCCTSGHEVVNVGCFQITDVDCTGCPGNCHGCAGSLDGSGNFLCVDFNHPVEPCGNHEDCPSGSACAGSAVCFVPC